MKQVNLRLPDDLYAAMESARGDVARNRWLTRAVEFAVGASQTWISPEVPSFHDEPTDLGDKLRSVPKGSNTLVLDGANRADAFRAATQKGRNR